MKILFNSFLFFLFFGLLTSCNPKSEECPVCFTPPNPFVFELVDKDTGENLFTNGTYNSEQVQVIDTSDDTTIEHTFISENNLNVISIHTIGWQSETVDYDLLISGNKILSLHVVAERKVDNCCNYTEYNEVTISDAEYELVNETGVYKIKI